MISTVIDFCNANWVPGLIGFFGWFILARLLRKSPAPPQTSASINMGGGAPVPLPTPGVKLARYMLAALKLGPNHWKIEEKEAVGSMVGAVPRPTLACTHPDYKHASVLAGASTHLFQIDGQCIDANIHEYTQFTTGTSDFSAFEQMSKAICSDLMVRNLEAQAVALVATITQKDAPTTFGERVFNLFCKALDDKEAWAPLASDPGYFHYRNSQTTGLAFRYVRHTRLDLIIANKYATSVMTEEQAEVLSEKMRTVLRLHPTRFKHYEDALASILPAYLPPV